MSVPPVTTETLTRRILQSASAQVVATEADAIGDTEGGVHEHRKAVRRLRAASAALRRLVDPDDIEPLRHDLTEWGRQLGEVRDAEVRAKRAAEALDAADQRDPDAFRRLVGDERAEAGRLRGRLRELERTPQAQHRQQLLRESGLDLRVNDADVPASKTYARVLRREARRVRRAAEAVDGSLGGYHALRKAGRRLRYIAEAVDSAEPGLLGKPARRLARAGERIHDILGDHRDLLLLAERAEATRSRAFGAQEATGPYDALAAAATRRAEDRLERLPKAVRRVRKAARAL